MKKKIFTVVFFVLIFLTSQMMGEAPSFKSSGLSRFSEKDRAKLMKKEIIYNYTNIKGEDGSGNGYGESSAIISQPIVECFTIFCDFNKHHLFIPRKKESKVIKSWSNKALVYKKFKVYFTTIEYTTLYTIHEDTYRVDFKMDPDYPHDLKKNSGYYKFEPIGEKNTLVTFALTKVETGMKVPKFIQRYLTSRDLPEVVGCIRKRIESGGTWVKN